MAIPPQPAPQTDVADDGVQNSMNKSGRSGVKNQPAPTEVAWSACKLHIHQVLPQIWATSTTHVEGLRVAECRVARTFRDSRDCKVQEAEVNTRSGCKWEASRALAQVEGHLKIKDIIRAHCTSGQGLGTTCFQKWGKANPRERRTMEVHAETRNLDEEQRKARVLGSQGVRTSFQRGSCHGQTYGEPNRSRSPTC